MKIDKILAEIENAKKKVAEWQARLKEYERLKTEYENTEIVRLVRGVDVSPEELAAALAAVRQNRDIKPSEGAVNENRVD